MPWNIHIGMNIGRGLMNVISVPPSLRTPPPELSGSNLHGHGKRWPIEWEKLSKSPSKREPLDYSVLSYFQGECPKLLFLENKMVAKLNGDYFMGGLKL
jgi:hypothetical protein